jgi:hypothetical protein
MDTDFLTRDAYQVLILQSRAVSAFLRADIGAAARRYPNEESYLIAMHQFVSTVADDPEGYLDGWNLLDEINPAKFGPQVARLAEGIMTVIRTPMENRGPVDEGG